MRRDDDTTMISHFQPMGWNAFGFTVRLRIANHRIQMRAGEGCLTIAEGNVVPNHSWLVQVRINDALGHCEHARLAGAHILLEPKDHAYGERQHNAEDFHGHRWAFTESMADVEPESWGGTSVNLYRGIDFWRGLRTDYPSLRDFT